MWVDELIKTNNIHNTLENYSTSLYTAIRIILFGMLYLISENWLNFVVTLLIYFPSYQKGFFLKCSSVSRSILSDLSQTFSLKFKRVVQGVIMSDVCKFIILLSLCRYFNSTIQVSAI